MCRICHKGDVEEKLVSPCDCTGTIGMLHISCLCARLFICALCPPARKGLTSWL